jgi:hypothetical protein
MIMGSADRKLVVDGVLLVFNVMATRKKNN